MIIFASLLLVLILGPVALGSASAALASGSLTGARAGAWTNLQEHVRGNYIFGIYQRTQAVDFTSLVLCVTLL
jgi:hypothetical protein